MPGQVGADDRPRGVADVVDVDGGEEAAAAARREPAVEDVAEQLVHLAAHPLEVGEEVALGHARTLARYTSSARLRTRRGSTAIGLAVGCPK